MGDTLEMLDVLHSDGSFSGKIASREEVHRKGLYHRTVHIWVLNSKGEILLQKRSTRKEVFPGLWDISCAGHLSAGDSSISGALRELKEELGLDVRETELCFLFTVPGNYSNGHDIVENETTDVYLLERSVSYEEILFNKEEIDQIKFITAARLKRLVQERDPELAEHGKEYLQLMDFLENRENNFVNQANISTVR